MKCSQCGIEITDKTEKCPECGFQPDFNSFSAGVPPHKKNGDAPESENKKEKNLAADLKSKIKKSFYIKKDLEEAKNYIELYLSMIGIDAEIMEYQEKILKIKEKINQPAEKPEEEIPSESQKTDEELFEFEFDSNQPQDKIPEEMARAKTIPGEPYPIKSINMFYELEDGEQSADGFEKELEIEVESKETAKPLDQEDLIGDEEGGSNEELLVLEPDEEILELEDELIVPQKPKAEKEGTGKSKDLMRQFEIEINQEIRKQDTTTSGNIFSLSEFENDLLNVSSEETGKEIEKTGEEKKTEESLTQIPDSVETMLDDLKNKKKKALRWLTITISIIAFISLIVTLYFLTKKNQTRNQPTTPASTIHQPQQKKAIVKKKDALPSSPEEERYKKFLKEAKNYFQRGDLKNAENSIGLAKKIKITDALSQLEQDINDQKKEQILLQEIEGKEEDNSIDSEVAYKKAISSSDIGVLEVYLKEYPSGARSSEIIKKIAELKKKERESLEQQLKQNLEQFRKTQLRSFPQAMSQEEIQDTLIKSKNIPRKTEIRIINGDKVFINYSTGLMWHSWKETMEFQKAKWWANREYAGYFNWRLPTAEEAATLSSADIPSFVEKNASPYEIWTSDIDSRDSRYTWVFLPLQEVFKSIQENQYKQVCSVRSL